MKKNEGNVIKWIMLKNSVAIICFTILAIVFNKWWISLLSIIFLSLVKYKKGSDKD